MLRCPSVSIRRSQSGIALVLVLWVIALLSVMAVAAVSTSRTEINLVHNRLDEARMRALAESAVGMFILRRSLEQREARWYPDAAPIEWQFAGEPLTIRIYNESSRINLNKASERILMDLVTAADMEGVEPEAVVAAILDWRDPDQTARLTGAENSDYSGNGLPYGAKDGPFDSVSELGLVLGLPRELSRQLEPHLTVHTMNPQVLEEYASPLVRAALQGDDEALLTEEEPELQGGADPEKDEGKRSMGGPIYRIRVTGEGPAAEILFRVGGGRYGVFSTIARRFDWRTDGEGNIASPGEAE